MKKEISPLIAAWHYFVHISCNFRLDNSGEKMPISGGRMPIFEEKETSRKKERENVLNFPTLKGNIYMHSSFNFWHARYLATDMECEF